MKHPNLWAAGALLMAVCSASSARDLIEIQRSAEVTLSAVTLPKTANDPLTLKECAMCPVSAHRVTAETEYLLNGQQIALADLLTVAAEIRAVRGKSDKTLVAVSLDIATERVTRVLVVHR